MAEPLQFVKVTESLATAPQVSPGHMAGIAEAGYKVVVNNRPDGEVPGQPTSAELQAAAEAAGMTYVYYPVNAFNYPGDDIKALGELFDNEKEPVFAFCRSGTRSTNLWISSRSPEDRNAALRRGQQIGYDVSMALQA